ncbi:MAG: HAD family hydrolase [Mailhella sp.]|nr:HAD family hydrolase [Mailhella sp.]
MSCLSSCELASWFRGLYGDSTPKGIIFDCDGVVIDSRDANISYYNFLRDFLGLPHLTMEQETFVQAATVNQAIDAIVPKPLRPLLRDAARHISYEKDILPRISCYPGLHDALRLCKSAGIRTGMATNRSDGMEKLLTQCRLHGFFDPIVLASDVPHPKPAPDGALLICSRWGARPSQLLFIGDSISDKGAADSAGIPFLSFQTQGLAEHAIADFATLSAAFKSLTSPAMQHFTACK